MYKEMIMELLENVPEITLRHIYFFIRGYLEGMPKEGENNGENN